MFSEKVATLGLPQLGLRFLAGSYSWNLNEKPQNCEILKNTEPTGLWQCSCTA